MDDAKRFKQLGKESDMNLHKLLDLAHDGDRLAAAELGLYDYTRREHTRLGEEFIRVMKVAQSDPVQSNRETIRRMMEISPDGNLTPFKAWYDHTFSELVCRIGFIRAVTKAWRDYAATSGRYNNSTLATSYWRYFGEHFKIICEGPAKHDTSVTLRYVVVTDLVGNMIEVNGRPVEGAWAEWSIENHVELKKEETIRIQ